MHFESHSAIKFPRRDLLLCFFVDKRIRDLNHSKYQNTDTSRLIIYYVYISIRRIHAKYLIDCCHHTLAWTSHTYLISLVGLWVFLERDTVHLPHKNDHSSPEQKLDVPISGEQKILVCATICAGVIAVFYTFLYHEEGKV